MEPAFQRGDLLFLWNRAPRAEVGEIVVYNVRGKDIPIVHRVVRAFGDGVDKGVVEDGKGRKGRRRFVRHFLCLLGLGDGPSFSTRKANGCMFSSVSEPMDPDSHKLLTKGDNNVADDTELYARGQDYLDRKLDLVGSVRGYVPAVGYVTIMLSEHPWLKTVLLGMMGVMVMLQRE